MLRFDIIFFVIEIGLLIFCLVDCISIYESRIKVLNKIAWVFIIILLPLLGPILWLVIGKDRSRDRPAERARDGRSCARRRPRVSEEGADHYESQEARIRRLEAELKALDDDKPEEELPATAFAVARRRVCPAGPARCGASPGSRSQALALAAAEYEREGLLRLHVRIDERVGGFLALGLAIETGLPVVVVTTSGTAVANLHPAVLKAHHAGVPLLVLSADRPESLRGISALNSDDRAGRTLARHLVRRVRCASAERHSR